MSAADPLVERAMGRLADVVLAHRRAVVAGWLALCLLGAVFAAGLPGRIVPGGEAPRSSQSEVVARALADAPLPSLFVTVEVAEGAGPAALERAAGEVARAVAEVPGVRGVQPLPDVPAATPRGERVAVLGIATGGGTDGATAVAHELAERSDELAVAGDVHVGGFGAYRDELTELSRTDLERAERAGLPIVFVVLLVTFGSVAAAALPLVIALSALVMGLGAVGAAAYVLPMSDFVTNAATMIGIALGVDYAMFLVQRVRALVREGSSVDGAVRTAVRTTGTAVLWSGVTVVAAEATLLLVDSRSIRSAAFGMVMVTVFAVLTALVVAPVVVSLLGERITRSRRPAPVDGSPRWRRWAERMTRRGPLWLGLATVVMVALAVPAAGLQERVGISGASTLPADSGVRQAYDLAAARYGPAALSPVTVLLGLDDDVDAAVTAVAADARVATVQPQPLPDGGTVLAVTSREGPYAASTEALVRDLRAGDGLVGGETAASLDATDAMFAGLPKVGVVLLLVVGAVLLLALRSVVLPLKAVVLVVLSLGSSLGGLVLLSTTELGARLIGADGPTDIHPIVPVTIVAITVALSTDYEVMLISRMAEHHRATGDDRASIVTGVAHTGGVITSAAVIMVAVFLGFALADLPPLKQLGVGLGLAVVLDATLVRAVLVPASMAVMGRANWWWPGQASRPEPAVVLGAGGSRGRAGVAGHGRSERPPDLGPVAAPACGRSTVHLAPVGGPTERAGAARACSRTVERPPGRASAPGRAWVVRTSCGPATSWACGAAGRRGRGRHDHRATRCRRSRAARDRHDRRTPRGVSCGRPAARHEEAAAPGVSAVDLPVAALRRTLEPSGLGGGRCCAGRPALRPRPPRAVQDVPAGWAAGGMVTARHAVAGPEPLAIGMVTVRTAACRAVDLPLATTRRRSPACPAVDVPVGALCRTLELRVCGADVPPST